MTNRFCAFVLFTYACDMDHESALIPQIKKSTY